MAKLGKTICFLVVVGSLYRRQLVRTSGQEKQESKTDNRGVGLNVVRCTGIQVSKVSELSCSSLLEPASLARSNKPSA